MKQVCKFLLGEGPLLGKWFGCATDAATGTGVSAAPVRAVDGQPSEIPHV